MPTVNRVVYLTPSRLLRTQSRPQWCSLTTAIALIHYNEQLAVRHKLNTPEECAPYLAKESVSWVDVRGLGNKDLLLRLSQVFQLHPLVLEDVMNVSQRPKCEDYNNQQLIICRMVLPDDTGEGFYNEQLSIILGSNYVLTVQEESEYDCFDSLRERLRRNSRSIRCQGADYLVYCLIDAITDGYFPVLEDYGERLEKLEHEVVRSPNHHTLEDVLKVPEGIILRF